MFHFYEGYNFLGMHMLWWFFWIFFVATIFGPYEPVPRNARDLALMQRQCSSAAIPAGLNVGSLRQVLFWFRREFLLAMRGAKSIAPTLVVHGIISCFYFHSAYGIGKHIRHPDSPIGRSVVDCTS